MCGGRSDDSSQDTSGSYNEAAQNFQAANPSYPSSGNYSARSASSIGMANQSFAGGLNEGQDGTPIGNFGMGEGQGNVNFSGATSDDGFAYNTPTFGNQGPNVSVTNFRSGNLYGGYEDDPAYDADIFGRRGGPTGRGGNLQGFDKTGYEGRSDQPRDPNVSSMGAFADSATRGGLLGRVADFAPIGGIMSALTGRSNMDRRRDNVMEFFDSGAEFNEDSGKLELDIDSGTLKMSDSGNVTYSGKPDPNYTGIYSNLVNPPTGGGGGGGQRGQTPLDPCPSGFKLDSATNACVPVDDGDGEGVMGSKFVRNVDMPDFSNYGLVGGEHRFFTEMPGIINAKDGLPRHPTGEVKGAGGPKDDLVGPIMLSNKEYVMPHEMIMEEGDGNYDKGIMLLEKKRMSALRKYRDRNKSSGRNTA